VLHAALTLLTRSAFSRAFIHLELPFPFHLCSLLPDKIVLHNSVREAKCNFFVRSIFYVPFSLRFVCVKFGNVFQTRIKETEL
jgi:hypothetical protein